MGHAFIPHAHQLESGKRKKVPDTKKSKAGHFDLKDKDQNFSKGGQY
jgi:hypothetical protein